LCLVYETAIPKKVHPLRHGLSFYRILQIVRGGKVSWLQNSTVIRWKTFAVDPSLPFFCYNLLSEGNYFTGKVLWLPTNLRKPQNFSTSNNLQYTVSVASFLSFLFPYKKVKNSQKRCQSTATASDYVTQKQLLAHMNIIMKHASIYNRHNVSACAFLYIVSFENSKITHLNK